MSNIKAASIEAKEKAAAARERLAKIERGEEVEVGPGKRADQAAIMRGPHGRSVSLRDLRRGFESLLPRLRQVRDCAERAAIAVWRKGHRR